MLYSYTYVTIATKKNDSVISYMTRPFKILNLNHDKLKKYSQNVLLDFPYY